MCCAIDKQMKPIPLIAFWIILTFCGCSNSKKYASEHNFKKLEISDKKIAIVYDTAFIGLITRNDPKMWRPTSKKVSQVDEILKNVIRGERFNFLKEPKTISLKNYYRQYFPYINDDNDSVIFINALCEILERPVDSSGVFILKKWDWKKYYIGTHDGGPCYWRIKINLTQNNYSSLMINGY